MLKSMWHTFYMRSLFCVSMVSVFCSVESMLSIHEFAVQNNIESYSFVSLNMFLLFNIATISIIIVLYFLLRGKIKSRNYAEAEEVVRLRETKRSIDEIGLSMDDIKSISCYKNEIKRLSQENANLLNRVQRSSKRGKNDKPSSWNIALGHICEYWCHCILELEKKVDDKSYFMSFKRTKKQYYYEISQYYESKEMPPLDTALEVSYHRFPALWRHNQGEPGTKTKRDASSSRSGLNPTHDTESVRDNSK